MEKVKANIHYTQDEPKEERIVVYQIMTRLFGNSNQTNIPYGTLEENGVGKFNDISDKAIEELGQLGATHLWFTGIIEHAVLTDYSAYGIPLDDADVVKGRAGSPYAIKDYYDVNPDLAVDVAKRMEEFEQLIHRTHQKNLKVIIDFVPNHVARFYQSDAKPEGIEDFGAKDDTSLAFSPSNNFYYIPGQSFQVPQGYSSLGSLSHPTKDGKFKEVPAKATGNDNFAAQPSVDDWFETVKLNYGVDIQGGGKKHFDPIPDTWNKMKDILFYWADKGVDGFRCDMAEMVPVEFWEWITEEVKSVYPDILFIAEIYNPDQYRPYISKGGFDYLYDKVQMYDTLRNIIHRGGSTDNIGPIIKYLKGINSNMLRFLENHDEQRIASPFFAENPWKALPAMVVSATISSGPVMIYFGQELGEPGAGVAGFSGEDGRTTIFDYWGVPEFQKWTNNGNYDGAGLSDNQKALRDYYKNILSASKERAFIGSHFYDLHPINRERNAQGYDEMTYSFLRWNEGQVGLVVCNFDPENRKDFKLNIPKDVWQFAIEGKESKLINRISEEAPYQVDADDDFVSITLSLGPMESKILIND